MMAAVLALATLILGIATALPRPWARPARTAARRTALVDPAHPRRL